MLDQIIKLINFKRIFFNIYKVVIYSLRIFIFKRKLLIIYDLECNGISYDYFIFMENALQYAKKKQITDLKILIIPSKNFKNFIFKKTQNKKEKKFSNEFGYLRLHNIIFNTLSFYKNVNSIELVNNRYLIFFKIIFYNHIFPNKFNIFGDYFNLSNQGSWRNLERNNKIKKLIGIQILEYYMYKARNLKKVLGDKKIVTISLRESSYSKYRNSNLKDWLLICKYLEKKGYQPIVIRDFEHSYNKNDKLNEYTLIPEATQNINLRAAIYKVAFHNFFPDSGYFPLGLLTNSNSSRWRLHPIINKKAYNTFINANIVNKNFPNQSKFRNNLIVLKEDKYEELKKFIDDNFKII